MTKIEPFEGYCEYLSCNTWVDVTYTKIASISNIKPQAKATRLDCEYLDECNLNFDCPVFKEASKNDTW